LDIPVRNLDRHETLRLEIEQEEAGREPERPAAWCVWLDFSPGDLGPIKGRVALHGEQVSVRLWAEQDSTARLFREHFDELGARLREEGFKDGVIECRHGQPPGRPFATLPAGLLDEHA
jgi:hypothetical protein